MGKPLDETKGAADDRAYDKAKRRLERGEDELLPAEFASRILDGESPIRVWREYRCLSIKDLAARIGLDLSDLTEIEMGQRKAPPKVVSDLAQALNLDPDDLV